MNNVKVKDILFLIFFVLAFIFVGSGMLEGIISLLLSHAGL